MYLLPLYHVISYVFKLVSISSDLNINSLKNSVTLTDPIIKLFVKTFIMF